jgi:hypothetical protein
MDISATKGDNTPCHSEIAGGNGIIGSSTAGKHTAKPQA